MMCSVFKGNSISILDSLRNKQMTFIGLTVLLKSIIPFVSIATHFWLEKCLSLITCAELVLMTWANGNVLVEPICLYN